VRLVQRWGFVADRWTIATDLWRFGEEALAERVLATSDDELFSIWVGAGELARRGNHPSKDPGWALAMSSIASLEGRERQLARARRRPRREAPPFPEPSVEARVDECSEILATRTWPEM
jgi:hypothetical protein